MLSRLHKAAYSYFFHNKSTDNTFLSGLAISGRTAQNGLINSRNLTEKILKKITKKTAHKIEQKCKV